MLVMEGVRDLGPRNHSARRVVHEQDDAGERRWGSAGVIVHVASRDQDADW